MFRRHLETAKLILSITDVQFKESEKSKSQRRYELADDSDYDSHDGEDDSSEDGPSGGLDISSRVIDAIYTYDNVADLQNSVGSKVSGQSSLDSWGVCMQYTGHA